MTAPTNPNVRQYLDASTEHLPPHVLDELPNMDGVTVYEYEYGAWLWVPDDPNEWLEESEYEIPTSVAELWRFARSVECDLVRLDSDAPVVAELPRYDWS